MAYSALSQFNDASFPSTLTDVRGFEVRTRDDDRKVGKVDDLVCTPDGQLRYLDVDLGGFFDPRHVVVPVGSAQVDRSNDVVWITGMTKEQIKALPDYTGDASTITTSYESSVRGVHGRDVNDADLYDQGRFYADRGGADARNARIVLSEEQLSIGKRQVQAGEVSIGKRVETEHVRESVPVTREEVTIERHPISADAAASSRDLSIGEDSIRVPLMREEVVAEKRVVPTEEVVLNKRSVTEERVVEEDLRRERAVIDDSAIRADSDVADRDASLDLDRDETTRGKGRNAARRAANALDDVKDRVDGNPASRPGPDKTDSGRRL